MVLILAQLKTWLDVFLGGMEGDGNLETQEINFTQINTIHSPMQVSENSFSCDITRSPLSPGAGGGTESFSTITPALLILYLCYSLPVSAAYDTKLAYGPCRKSQRLQRSTMHLEQVLKQKKGIIWSLFSWGNSGCEGWWWAGKKGNYLNAEKSIRRLLQGSKRKTTKCKTNL